MDPMPLIDTVSLNINDPLFDPYCGPFSIDIDYREADNGGHDISFFTNFITFDPITNEVTLDSLLPEEVGTYDLIIRASMVSHPDKFIEANFQVIVIAC